MKTNLKNLAALTLVLASQAAWATKGTPQFLAMAATPDFPVNAAIMEETEMAAFEYDPAACATEYGSMPAKYVSAKPLLLRIGVQLYRAIPDGVTGFPNRLVYADAEGCVARDLSKVKKMTLGFENTLLPLVRQVMEWDTKTSVVTFTTPELKVVTSAGVVVLKHGDIAGGPMP